MSLKIIHYVPSIDRASGGVSTYIQQLSKELGKICSLYIVTSNTKNPLSIENAKVIYISNKLIDAFEIKKEWKKILLHINPNLVHINCCWMPLCSLTQKWAQELGFKVVLTPHGMLEPWIISRNYYTKKLPALILYQRSAISNADYIHATAYTEKENILKLNINNKVEVIANGIDVDCIKLKENWDKKKNILFLSRIHVKKGIEFLIQAISILKEEMSDYVINIVGEGDQKYINFLKKRVNELGIANMINFLGGVYDNKKWELYRNADIFILPTFSENFGLVIAEALASGTPVITTNGTPWKELNTEKCGWYTDIGVKPIINALSEFLLLSPNELKEMGLNGRYLIEREYSTKKIANDMLLFYKKLL